MVSDLRFSNLAEHPRLFLNKGEETKVFKAVQSDSVLYDLHNSIIAFCDKVIDEPPYERVKVGRRLNYLLNGNFLQRVYNLCYAYRMTGNKLYAARAEQEMLAICKFQDWNPSHWLDTAGALIGMAIGYDWLYDYLSSDTKAFMRNAIINKGILTSFSMDKFQRFYTRQNNWNQICNTAIVCASLAIFENAPDFAKSHILIGLLANRYSLQTYGPDGAFPEGYGYWAYGTSYQIAMISAMETALGSDCGLSNAAGFMKSAEYENFMRTPTGRVFNFSDCGDNFYSCNLPMFWFASRQNDPSLLWIDLPLLKAKNYKDKGFLPNLIIDASKLNLKDIHAPEKQYWFSRGENPIFIYREGWSSPDDTYLGVKGGTPSASHAHMDAGSFVFERDGVRWVTDLGSQNYNMVESAGKDMWSFKQNSFRWKIFRISNQAHSTLTLNGGNHCVDAHAEITKTFQTAHKKGCVVDLTSTLGEPLKKAERSLFLDDKDNLHIVDILETGNASADIMWVLNTEADAEILKNHGFKLTVGNKSMDVAVIAPGMKKLSIWSNEPAYDFEQKNPTTRRVGFEVSLKANEKYQIEVILTR